MPRLARAIDPVLDKVLLIDVEVRMPVAGSIQLDKGSYHDETLYNGVSGKLMVDVSTESTPGVIALGCPKAGILICPYISPAVIKTYPT